MQRSRRRILEASGIALTALAGCVQAPENTSARAPTGTPTSSPTATPTSTPSGLDGEITVKGEEWALIPERITVKENQPVELTFENVGSIAHNVMVGEFDAKTDTIQPGQSDTITFTPDRSGEFAYWCDVAGHRDAGMEGILVVED